VYITNVVKCGLWRTGSDKFVPNRGTDGIQTNVRNNCVGKYLSKEIAEFNPRVIFAFGCNAYNAYNAAAKLDLVNQVRIEYLRHPSARGSFVGTIKSNDQTISEVLQDAGLL
jgi:uracil-DNA glycosylase